jgi:ribonuclease PH
MARHDGRANDDLRPIRFERGFTDTAPGSVLSVFGRTEVLCTAMYVDGVPPFLQGRGQGWLTAEYAMLPSASQDRKPRDRGIKIDGRSIEIQRLIGRALRVVVDLAKLTERTIWIDCDVLQADGGTRCAAISGAWVALHDCLSQMDKKRILRGWPLRTQVAAVSVGKVQNEILCDLDYSEDSKAQTDMNLVMTGQGEFIEVQGSAEGAPFGKNDLQAMLETGSVALQRIFGLQKAALAAT